MRWISSRRGLWISVATLGAIAILAISLSLLNDRRLHGETPSAGDAAKDQSGASSASPAQNSVALTDAKLKAAGITVEKLHAISLPVEVVVSGRIEANVDRRIDIRPRAAGIVRTVNVQIGQAVKAGEPLVTLDSADIGTARLNLRNRQRDLAIAQSDAEWKSTIAANVQELIPLVRKNIPISTLEKQFAAKPLGTDRGILLSAYADWQIATHEEEKQNDLFKKNIVGEHPVYVSIHTREGAQAKFEAALEQVRYDTGREKRLADQQVRVAAAAVIDAAQRLRILGAPVDLRDVIDHAERTLSESKDADRDDITAYTVTAPFDGTIISRSAVPSQRAEPTDILFTLADLSRVRVQASIPESNLAVLPSLSSGTVRVTAAAYPGKTFEAKVLTVGAQVDPATRTVSLIAETDNPQGLWKLGMLVWVAIDSPKTEVVTTVPDAAVVEIDGKTGVFLPHKDGKTFTFHPVTVGRQVQGRNVVTSGVSSGQVVVTTGAFNLKSELILQNDTGED